MCSNTYNCFLICFFVRKKKKKGFLAPIIVSMSCDITFLLNSQEPQDAAPLSFGGGLKITFKLGGLATAAPKVAPRQQEPIISHHDDYVDHKQEKKRRPVR